MDYVLSEHARDALQKRQIPLAWMERVLRAPEVTEVDRVDPDLEHRLARIPEFGNRVLRVIVNGKKTPPIVVTAFFDRRRTIP
ncbi:MAG TPA: DUF4258 domain-containing protein [Thermosynechococcus sp. M3746_W2019_013]|jgi:hypothetical protein|uniref:DUF4258 domain-containing protein n=1 Tax=Thermosynechococcus sp. M3746_W2019_013 TaxID=2747806 RepID=UPI0019FB8C3A|nr:DUF4258 domain-containing protein [Thermosynechococcus sp. M3746_W2019_013]HIK23460.1 DUF4258 domain-containing protein [Thermosynechococcus sp. M3746_W2019_013]